MNTFAFAAAFLTLWVVVGLVTAVWMIRRGHSPLWMFVAVVLGPLFAPIGLERIELGTRRVRSGHGKQLKPRTESSSGPRILVGMDGSPESDQALATAVKFFGDTCEVLMLAEVVYYEAAEGTSQVAVDATSARLVTAAESLERQSVPASFEVLAGPAGRTLRSFAEQQHIDLIVVGRRGRGLTNRLMGSVSSDLVQRSAIPVLVAEPPQRAADLGVGS